ncbi:MAG: tRNA (adenosine(37)-N6)-threonylcarbamoyltransferase complex ATPase subunit type 1 TsaE [Candidatus Marinimicrobia bacterium]|nr:tRNA (adenosine(37)-N6)-threonylcarbamoyltransferase complex ATPase subunit type 1 TsaE [Candidatus Neomarinimicrobiota bacterium]
MKKDIDFGISYGINETIQFGKKLAKIIEPGDVFKLEGDLGAGKTTFIKGVVNALGYNGIVSSPTYTLINEYNINPKIVHIDCYREQNIDRWFFLGINDYFDDNSIIFIEWPEILESIIPINKSYKIRIKSIGNNKRDIRFSL